MSNKIMPIESKSKRAYVAYLRQSTIKQQISGFGIEAQREIIKNDVKQDSCILQAYVATETGKDNKRPKLTEALELCRQTGSILICTKLDRLSRNVSFTSRLAGCCFDCYDEKKWQNLLADYRCYKPSRFPNRQRSSFHDFPGMAFV